jgi:hypothetical protein
MRLGGPAPAAVACGTAVVIAGLVLSACTGPARQSSVGSVSGRANLYGRVPGEGRPFTVGAVQDGKVVATAKLHPGGGPFNLAVPPGKYQVGLWIPGIRQLTVAFMTCATDATVHPGRSAVITLTCDWHG